MRRFVAFAAVLAPVAVLLAAFAGCSCEDSEPAPRQVVREADEQQARPAQPAAQAPEPAKPQRQPGNSLLHAPGDYLTQTTVTVPRHIKSKARMAQTQNEIKQFQAMQGRYPLSLKELEQWRGAQLQEPPGGYTYKYDSNTGELDVVPIP